MKKANFTLKVQAMMTYDKVIILILFLGLFSAPLWGDKEAGRNSDAILDSVTASDPSGELNNNHETEEERLDVIQKLESDEQNPSGELIDRVTDKEVSDETLDTEHVAIEEAAKRGAFANLVNYAYENPLPAGEGGYRTSLNKRMQPQGNLYANALPSTQGHAGPEFYTIPMPDNALIERYDDLFSLKERKKILQAIFQRAKLYRGYIASRIKEQDVPPELLFLPVIESSFSIKAVSSAGARGLWQFMPGTARHLGLVIDDWVDERQDFWKATLAALKKLKTDKEFLGDWYLALAAYHCGTGRVLQAIKNSKIKNPDYWDLSAQKLLPKSTIQYVPTFLAACKVATYPGRYGFTLSWEKSPEWERVELDRMIDIEILAKLTNIPLDTLKAGNAELKGYFTPPTMSTYALKVPAPYKEKVLACVRDARITLIKYHYHIIRSGDTVYGLAKRYGIKEDLIRKANPDIRPAALRIGATLKIPVPEGAKIPQEPKTQVIKLNLPFTKQHVVTKGDTLWGIAKFYGTTLEELVKRNNITVKTIIRQGDKLLVPKSTDKES